MTTAFEQEFSRGDFLKGSGALVVALGLPAADPVIGLVISLVILHITWQSWRTVRHG